MSHWSRNIVTWTCDNCGKSVTLQGYVNLVKSELRKKNWIIGREKDYCERCRHEYQRKPHGYHIRISPEKEKGGK